MGDQIKSADAKAHDISRKKMRFYYNNKNNLQNCFISGIHYIASEAENQSVLDTPTTQFFLNNLL